MISDTQFEGIILAIYAQDEQEINAMHGGFPMHYCMLVEKCQKLLWKAYKINRPQFLKLFATFFANQPQPLPTEIHAVCVYGGVSSHFKKRNWVCINGKKYILFQIRLGEYRNMRIRENKLVLNGSKYHSLV